MRHPTLAKQWLKLNNITILSGYNKILGYYGPLHIPEYSLPTIKKGSLKFEKTKPRLIKNYYDLQNTNLFIIK